MSAIGGKADVHRAAIAIRMDDDADQSQRDTHSKRGHMDQHPQNAWGSVQYDSRFDEYWVQAGEARQALFYCPWCGEKLPASQHDLWFDKLEALGINPCEDEVPESFRSGAWRGDKQ